MKSINLFKEIFLIINQHKAIFILLIFLQLVFLGSLGYITTTNLQQMLEGTQGILSQLEQANLDPQKINAGQPFLPDVKPLYDSYQIIKKYALRWLAWLLAILLTVYPLLWIISSFFFRAENSLKNLKRQFRDFGKQWLIFFCLIFSAALILWLSSLFLVKSSIFNDPNQEELYFRLRIIGFLSLGIYYLFICFAAQLSAPTVKAFFQRSFKTSISRIYYSLPLVLILSAMIYGAAWLLKIALEQAASFFLVVLATIFFAAVIVLARIIWIGFQQQGLRKLDEIKDN